VLAGDQGGAAPAARRDEVHVTAALAWRNLWRNPRRTWLTLSAIVFGTFLSVMFTAMQDRSFADMIDLAARLGGGHVLLQHPAYRDEPTLSHRVGGVSALRARAEADPRVVRTVARVTGQLMVQTPTNQLGAGFVAFEPSEEDDSTLSFLRGVEGTLQAGPHDIVLGRRLASNLKVGLGGKVVYTFVGVDGEIVSGLGRVSGVVETGAPSVDGGLVLLPLAAVREVGGFGPDEATTVGVYLRDSRRSGDVVDALGPGLPAGVAALGWSEAQPDLSGFIAMKVGGARFMEAVLMILVAAGIFNTLFMSVMERSREFGVLAAIGCSRGRLFAMVMWESLWLGLLGLAGAALVTAGPYWYLSTHGIDLSARLGAAPMEVAGVGMPSVLKIGIFPENLALVAAFALGATLTAGLWPAWQASRVPPVEAIRLQ
jgi:ABC-type lipoprotein release transport system permease subunit